MFSSPLPELEELERLTERLARWGRVQALAQIPLHDSHLTVWGLSLGASAPHAPSVAFVGGVHGLERIGTQVVLSYLHTLSRRLEWDQVLHDLLAQIRLVFVPLTNPGGMARGTRSNPRGVDLMRNAPPYPGSRGTYLVGGQRLSRKLPWYAGEPEEGLELESAALVSFMTSQVLTSRVSLAIDCHSGFGMQDRLWFPYARTRAPFPRLAEVIGIKRLIDSNLPNHVYKLEPQAQTYTIAGDLWDHIFDVGLELDPRRVFIPLTLEMGSWTWVRKNPRQLSSVWGSFNPIAPHRLQRTLRRHLPLFDLLIHAVRSPGSFLVSDHHDRLIREHTAYHLWP